MRTVRWLLLALVASPHVAAAQDYPVKPVRLLVPYPAGGPVDAVARLLAPHLGLGQTVIVDSRSGAGGSLGAEVVAKSPPDGYMMLIGNSGPMTINPVLQPHLGYDPKKDFAPVAWLTSGQMVLMVHPSLPVRSVKDLIALARSKPGVLNYGTAGVGNTTHLGMELLQTMAKVKLNHVPYKGVAPAYVGVDGGTDRGHVRQHHRPAPAYPVGAAARHRSDRAEDFPRASGGAQGCGRLSGFRARNVDGMFLPARTPEPIRARLQGEFSESCK